MSKERELIDKALRSIEKAEDIARDLLKELNEADYSAFEESERMRKEIEADNQRFLSDREGWDHKPVKERKTYKFPKVSTH